MCYSSEKWCKIWKGIDLLFKIDMTDLMNFDPSVRALSFPLELFDWDDSFTSIIPLSHDCQGFLIYSSDFNVCTDRARICFNMSS